MAHRAYADIRQGDSATFSKTITEHDVYGYAGIVGDFNPVHIDEETAKKSAFGGRIAHGMLGAGLISTVLGTDLPGPGTIYLGQELSFRAPVRFGDTLTARCEVVEKRDDKNIIKLNTTVRNQNGDDVILGTAVVKKPD